MGPAGTRRWPTVPPTLGTVTRVHVVRRGRRDAWVWKCAPAPSGAQRGIASHHTDTGQSRGRPGPHRTSRVCQPPRIRDSSPVMRGGSHSFRASLRDSDEPQTPPAPHRCGGGEPPPPGGRVSPQDAVCTPSLRFPVSLQKISLSRNRLTDTENKLTVPKGEGSGEIN